MRQIDLHNLSFDGLFLIHVVKFWNAVNFKTFDKWTVVNAGDYKNMVNLEQKEPKN